MSRESQRVGREIVKVQMPVSGPGLPLVYDRHRLHISQQRVSVDVHDAMGESAKLFFWAVWNKATRQWDVESEVAPWQTW